MLGKSLYQTIIDAKVQGITERERKASMIYLEDISEHN